MQASSGILPASVTSDPPPPGGSMIDPLIGVVADRKP
jgi:hypothetical protein